MKSKTYLYLGILAALAIAAYFLTGDKGEKTSSYKLSEQKLFEVDSAKVDKIELTNTNGTILISKTSGEWKVEQPYQYKTVSAGIENIVSNLKNMKLESIVSTNSAKKDIYGFKEPDETVVTVYESGVQKGKFILGAAASGGNASYVKKMDSDNIYIADAIDRNNFVKADINDWRDKSIVSIPKQTINSVEFVTPSGDFTVKRDSSGGYFLGSDSVGKAFDGILNLLGAFTTNTFKDTTLSDQTVFTEKIIIDWGPKTEMKFLKLNTTPVKYLLVLNNDNQIYELDEAYAKNLLKNSAEIMLK
ncbi:MAG: DUF4340 domain-containing protein [bacterium]